MRLIATLWCLIPLFLCGQFKVKTFGDPAIPGNEPSISIDPNDADNIWLAFNNNHVYHSLNGGKQWLDIQGKSTSRVLWRPCDSRNIGRRCVLSPLGKESK